MNPIKAGEASSNFDRIKSELESRELPPGQKSKVVLMAGANTFNENLEIIARVDRIMEETNEKLVVKKIDKSDKENYIEEFTKESEPEFLKLFASLGTGEEIERVKAKVLSYLNGEGLRDDLWEFPVKVPKNAFDQKFMGGAMDSKGRSSEVVGGGENRMMWISLLAQKYKKLSVPVQFLITGGPKKIGTETYSKSNISKDILHSDYGVDAETLEAIGDDADPDTYGDAFATLKYINENQEKLGDVKEVEFVSNDFHALRVWFILVKVFYENQFGKKLIFSEEDRDEMKKWIADFRKVDTENASSGIKILRDKIMNLVTKKYLDKEGMKVKFIPKVLEDGFEGTKDVKLVERAQQLRKDSDILDSVRGGEAVGWRKLVDGEFKLANGELL